MSVNILISLAADLLKHAGDTIPRSHGRTLVTQTEMNFVSDVQGIGSNVNVVIGRKIDSPGIFLVIFNLRTTQQVM